MKHLTLPTFAVLVLTTAYAMNPEASTLIGLSILKTAGILAACSIPVVLAWLVFRLNEGVTK